MQPKDIGYIKDTDVQESLNYIFEQAQGKIIVLSKAPTDSAPLLEDKTVGIYDGTLYWRVASTIYSITPDDTITITNDEV